MYFECILVVEVPSESYFLFLIRNLRSSKELIMLMK